MAARTKPSPFSVASGHYAKSLRTASVEPTKVMRRGSTHESFHNFESQWHRFVCKTSHSTTFH